MRYQSKGRHFLRCIGTSVREGPDGGMARTGQVTHPALSCARRSGKRDIAKKLRNPLCLNKCRGHAIHSIAVQIPSGRKPFQSSGFTDLMYLSQVVDENLRLRALRAPAQDPGF